MATDEELRRALKVLQQQARARRFRETMRGFNKKQQWPDQPPKENEEEEIKLLKVEDVPDD